MTANVRKLKRQKFIFLFIYYLFIFYLFKKSHKKENCQKKLKT